MELGLRDIPGSGDTITNVDFPAKEPTKPPPKEQKININFNFGADYNDSNIYSFNVVIGSGPSGRRIYSIRYVVRPIGVALHRRAFWNQSRDGREMLKQYA